MARDIIWFDTIDSTMLEAARRAEAGCAHGTVICAEEQTAGMGRFGRKWHSERGAGLYASIVLRTRLKPETLPVLTLALGLAASEAIAATSGLACDLRWPNDVLIGSRKCAGILVQLQDGVVIAGIGINVNHTAFPSSIAATATSLRLASGREQSREALLAQLLSAIDRYVGILEQAGPEPVLRMFTQASSYVRGRRVVVDQDNATLAGVTDGLTPAGFLKLREDNGTLTVIMAGGVRPAAESHNAIGS
jgi:BirA family biotin operon repressor/biotin-[acetyl-CoA-carboxylase] ligase